MKSSTKKTFKSFIQTENKINQLENWNQIGEEEVKIAAEMVGRNEISGGTPIVRKFEAQWREWIGSRFCITTINGTSALYAAYFGLGVGPGDEVICPVNTWIGTIAPVPFLYARPIFCDINPDSLLLDPNDVRKKITENTRCIVAVHLWGNVCNMDEILAIGEEYKIPVIEDCSHAHGAKFKGKLCGGFGDMACWSLQGSKAISGGEGGVLTTNNADAFERACLMSQVNRITGIDQVSRQYEEHQPLGLGMKLRAHPLGIGIASVQFGKLNELNSRREAYISKVEKGLEEIPGLSRIKVSPNAQRGGFYAFPLIHDPNQMGILTESYVNRLKKEGIEARMNPYPNLHDLPLYAKGFDLFTRDRGPLCKNSGYKGYRKGDFPHAELTKERTIFLPKLSAPKRDAAQIVLDALKRACR